MKKLATILAIFLSAPLAYCQDEADQSPYAGLSKRWSFQLFPPMIQMHYPGSMDSVDGALRRTWWITAWPPEFGMIDRKWVTIYSPLERLSEVSSRIWQRPSEK